MNRNSLSKAKRHPGGGRIATSLLSVALCAFMPAVAHGQTVEYTTVPAYGTFGNLLGSVSGVDPALFRVANYIRVNGDWWTKPTLASPTVAIQGDSTWSADITTGGFDHFATEIASFLMPLGVSPPAASGVPTLPAVPQAVASVSVTRGPPIRILNFAGREWTAKRSDFAIGPGPNFFTDRVEDLWVDSEGLHLSIRFFDGRWRSTEVILNESLGYGTYVIVSKGRVDLLDPNVVLGMFTWDPVAPEVSFRELDIVEHAKWGDPDNPTTSQFVVQPCGACPGCGQCSRFSVSLTDVDPFVTHVMTWQPGTAIFRAYEGRHLSASPPANKLIHEWTLAGAAIPEPGLENIRLNFWLMSGLAPLDGLDDEVVITDFGFSPVWVDFANSGTELGTEALPFNTLQEAVDAVLADGVVNIKGDTADTTSPEAMTIDKALTLQAVNGAVRIGQAEARANAAGFVSRPNRR